MTIPSRERVCVRPSSSLSPGFGPAADDTGVLPSRTGGEVGGNDVLVRGAGVAAGVAAGVQPTKNVSNRIMDSQAHRLLVIISTLPFDRSMAFVIGVLHK
jgi:hypothetical protein